MTGSQTSNRAPRAPLHEQVKETIARDIADGVHVKGHRLPAERLLCQALDVSRLTLRRALQSLVEEGVLESAPSRGWFVADDTIGEPANQLLSFSDMARSRGLSPSARIISRSIRGATLDEAESLRIPAGSELLDLFRLRLLDRTRIAVDRSRIPVAIAPALTEYDFERSSLYQVLRESGNAPARAAAVVQAVAADAEQSTLLHVAAGTPLLCISQVSYRADGQPVELGVIAYLGDRYRFRADLVAPRHDSD
jgi:DNA-binding GntR family transcriptional regulator